MMYEELYTWIRCDLGRGSAPEETLKRHLLNNYNTRKKNLKVFSIISVIYA